MNKPTGPEKDAGGITGHELGTAPPDITANGTVPWLIRTYAGHSTAAASNALYRKNLAKGQTGLSVAFDLPTQTGYDPDHLLARGEVGKVGVPVSPSRRHARPCFDGIPLERMNTSMTINATGALAPGALHCRTAEKQGASTATSCSPARPRTTS